MGNNAPQHERYHPGQESDIPERLLHPQPDFLNHPLKKLIQKYIYVFVIEIVIQIVFHYPSPVTYAESTDTLIFSDLIPVPEHLQYLSYLLLLTRMKSIDFIQRTFACHFSAS